MKERIEANTEKERKEWFRTAWLAAEIVSYLSGKRITISDLLPEMFPGKEWTKKEIKEELKDLKKRLKIK